MNRLNFSYEGKLLKTKVSKLLSIFLVIAFLVLQTDYAFADDAQRQEAKTPSSKTLKGSPPAVLAMGTSGGSSGGSLEFASPMFTGS